VALERKRGKGPSLGRLGWAAETLPRNLNVKRERGVVIIVDAVGKEKKSVCPVGRKRSGTVAPWSGTGFIRRKRREARAEGKNIRKKTGSSDLLSTKREST